VPSGIPSKHFVQDQTKSVDICRAAGAIEDLSRMFNPIIRAWLQYYGRYYRSALYPTMRDWTETWSFGPSPNKKSCDTITAGRRTGSHAFRAAPRSCSLIGR
jgi:hypothetical protein